MQTLQFLADLANKHKVTQVNPGKTNRTDGAFQLFKDGKVGMVMGFSPLAAQLDAEGKVDYGVGQMPTNAGASVTLGVEDYLMAFKKKGNQDAVKKFLDLYYQPENITRWIAAEGFLPVTKSGLRQMSGNAKLQPYLDALPNARLAPTTDPAWDKVKLDVQQSIGLAVQPGGDPRQVLDRAPEERRGRGERPLTRLTPAGRGLRAGAASGSGPAWRSSPPSCSTRPSQLVRASLGRYSITGLYQGAVGTANYARLAEQEALPAVVANTVVWVVVVVGGHARDLARARPVPRTSSFPGRRLVRWALIVPWAASLIMTAKLFVWIYDYYFGILNHALASLRPAPAAGRLAGRRRHRDGRR